MDIGMTIELAGPFTSQNWEEVALLTKENGCSDKDVEWAKQCNFSDFKFDRESTQYIKGAMRRVIIFKVDKSMSTLALNEATSMDGWYFRKTNSGSWDYRK
jgi:phage regulator Rha-like protein